MTKWHVGKAAPTSQIEVVTDFMKLADLKFDVVINSPIRLG